MPDAVTYVQRSDADHRLLRRPGEEPWLAGRHIEDLERRSREVVDVQPATWPQHPSKVGDGRFGVIPVVQADRGDDQVEGAARETAGR